MWGARGTNLPYSPSWQNHSNVCCWALLVAAAGLYAGVLLMYSVGIAPVLDTYEPGTFLHFWQTHDYFLHLRIRFLYGVLGGLYLLTFAALLPCLRTPRAEYTHSSLLLIVALLFSAAEVWVNRTLQRPVNRSIRLSDVGTHSAASVYGMEQQIFHALHLRQALSIAAFGVLIVAAMLPQGDASSPSRSSA